MINLFIFISSIFFQSDFDKGVALYNQKKYNDAIVFFEKVIQKSSNHLSANEYLGDIYGRQAKWDESIFYYKKLKNLEPQNANFHYKYGGSLGMKAKSISKFKALGLIDDIKLAFETAAKLDKKHIESRWALVMFYIELPVVVGGSEKKSRIYANELLDISKVDGFLALGHIESYYKRYEIAEKHYLKAHEIGQSKTTFEKLYDLYLNKLKNKAKAQELYKTYHKK